MTVSVRGISSGIDINSIIGELMHVERQPIRQNEARIERTEQIAGLWREINARLDTLSRTLPPLQNRLTFTAPMPKSGNPEVLTAKISGTAVKGSYRFNVAQLATRHAVATSPPAVGQRVSSANSALGYHGSFHLGTGRPPEGIEKLSFNSEWLRGSVGSGFQAVVSSSASDIYTLDLEEIVFSTADQFQGAAEIKVYMDSFTGSGGEDLSAELNSYFSEKGWDADLNSQPIFVIKDGAYGWGAYNNDGETFAFLGDHPLGTFNLRGEIVDGSGNTVGINNFTFEIRDSVDESALIMIRETDSLLAIAEKINAKSSATGISASVVMANDNDYRLVLESSVEGGDGFIQAFDYTPLNTAGRTKYGEDAVLAALHLVDSAASGFAGTVYAAGAETEEAKDAIFALNGLEMVRSSNSFTNVIGGLEITLTGIGPVTLDVAPDVDSALEEIELFVQAVNEVNSYLRVLQEDKKGPLQGSGDVMRVERQLRTLIHGLVPDLPGSSHLNQPLAYSGGGSAGAVATGSYTGNASKIELIFNLAAGEWRHNGVKFNSGDTIDGVTITIGPGSPQQADTLTLIVSPPSEPLKFSSLASIGIMASDKEGILSIDNAKLRAALTDDPEGIFLLFAREAPSGSSDRPGAPHGIVSQMKSLVSNMVGSNGFVRNRQDYLQRQIVRYEERIEALERRMEMREQRLVRQFTFMEQYISRIQEQTGLLASFEMMIQNQRDQKN
jgi:flagellar capping protein FliD